MEAQGTAGAAPPAEDPLPPAAAEQLDSCISRISASTWSDSALLPDTLSKAEGLLCALRGCSSLHQYFEQVSGGAAGGGASGPCTRVWTAGTIAYRCRTCGLSPSAAICVECFFASDHEGHDYVMYTSDAGGCCDCGDLSSWRPEGCCAHHRPLEGGRQLSALPPLPPAEEVAARGIVGCALARLQLALEDSLRSDPSGGPVALQLMKWLGQLGQQPVLRELICSEVLQPAAPGAAHSAAQQAEAAAAVGQLPAEVAEVARTLQLHRAALLGQLQQAVPRDADQQGRPLPVLGPRQKADVQVQVTTDQEDEEGLLVAPLLYWQLSALLPLDASLAEELTTLHILLLYSTPFKERYGSQLLLFYPHIGALGKEHSVTKALDRLTVQVFHLEETTLALTQSDNALGVLLDCLLDVLRAGVGATGKLSGGSEQLKGRLYQRIAADLHMCLSHPSVVLQLLGGPCMGLFSTSFLEAFRLLEGAGPIRRKLGEHVLFESTDWTNLVQLEVHLMHLLKQGVLHTLLKAAEEGTVSAEVAAQALAFGLQQCLEAVQVAAGPMQNAPPPSTFWSTLLSGASEISVHIPLERLAAAFLAALLHLGTTSSQPEPALAAAADSLGTNPELTDEQRAAATRRWRMCGLAAARVVSWMSQIRQRLWVRNGQQMLRLEAFFTSPYWFDHGLDCDLLAMQAWLATNTDLNRSLGLFMADGGAASLLNATTATSLAEAVELLATHRQPQELLRCSADWMRLMVTVLRERTVWHPTFSHLQLRRAIIHTLAAGPRGHSALEDELPYELSRHPLFDEVLSDVADYRPPTARSTGVYVLKRNSWRKFDPFYPHFTRRDLQAALESAQESNVWQPEWQLALGFPPLPAPMGGLQRVLHHLLRLVWAALVLACTHGGGGGGTEGGVGGRGGNGGGAAEDSAVAATNLLALVLQHKAAAWAQLIGCAGAQDTTAAHTAAVAAAPELQAAWATPATFHQKLEAYLTGSPPGKPGILYLLRVLAGSEVWLDGSRREASWELKGCASAAAAQAQQLLQAVRQHQHQVAAAGEADAAATASLAAAAAASDQTPSEAAPAAAAAAEDEQADRRLQAKQRQQRLLARMRARQAKAAASFLEEDEMDAEQGAGPSACAAAQSAVPPRGTAAAMDIDSQQHAVAAAGEAASTQHQEALPAHHPATWEWSSAAECALCHSGSDTAPLGLVAQLQVTELPLLASTDPSGPITPEAPGLPGAAVGAPPDASANPPAFPAAAAGPRLSLFDRQPSMHVMCCGHVLHAACLERYRSSWRQRIATGEFVEGFQLLQQSVSSGEYLCPICRRLGNCLLPLALPPGKAGSAVGGDEGQQEVEPLSPQAALRSLQQLVAAGSTNWGEAPASANPQLLQQWQEAMGDGTPAPNIGIDLVPQLGCHAVGVAGLANFAKLLGSKWIRQQQSVLEWLQARAATAERGGQKLPLWGIPVMPAAHPPQAGAAPQDEAPSLQVLLQRLEEATAAGDTEGMVEALGAAAQAAAAGNLDEQLGEGNTSEEEEEFAEDGAPQPFDAGFAALFQQLHRQVTAAAEGAAAAGQQRGAAAAGPAAVGGQDPAGAAAEGNQANLADGYVERLYKASVCSSLWSLLGSGITQWEVTHRDPAGAPAAEVDAAHWRALQSLTQLAMAAACGVRSGPAVGSAISTLEDLTKGYNLCNAANLTRCLVNVDSAALLLPTMLQLQQPAEEFITGTSQDPFQILLEVLPLLLSSPGPQDLSNPLEAAVHRLPGSIAHALLAVLYPLAAAQAAAQSTVVGPDSIAALVAAAEPPSTHLLARKVELAVAGLLLPWLRRAALLVQLISGGPVAAPAQEALNMQAILHQLHLPPLADALLTLPQGLMAPSSATEAASRPQLTIRTALHELSVLTLPPPSAPKLLQLPTSYQGWYLSLGTRNCSTCGQIPMEPALCLRCGAVMCCMGRRCRGPMRMGMCYTHSVVCGGGTCCFLLTKMTRLLVIRKNRASFLSSPYVDIHGEEDVSLQRGKPLLLHHERLRHVLQLWRGAALDFDSQVLHSANQHNNFATIY